jgi:hypothetical protein
MIVKKKLLFFLYMLFNLPIIILFYMRINYPITLAAWYLALVPFIYIFVHFIICIAIVFFILLLHKIDKGKYLLITKVTLVSIGISILGFVFPNLINIINESRGGWNYLISALFFPFFSSAISITFSLDLNDTMLKKANTKKSSRKIGNSS